MIQRPAPNQEKRIIAEKSSLSDIKHSAAFTSSRYLNLTARGAAFPPSDIRSILP
jgi:hypothetical protein